MKSQQAGTRWISEKMAEAKLEQLTGQQTKLSKAQVASLADFDKAYPNATSDVYKDRFIELVDVTEFNVQDMDFSGDVTHFIHFIQALPESTTSLSLINCGLSAVGLQKACTAIKNSLPSLKTLIISCNNESEHAIADIKFHPLPNSIENLHVFNNNFGVNGFQNLIPLIYNLNNLKFLDICGIESGGDPKPLLKLIGSKPSLTHLEINSNELTQDCLYLFETFTYKLPKLSYLDVRYCNLAGSDDYINWLELIQYNKNTSTHNETLFFCYIALKNACGAFAVFPTDLTNTMCSLMGNFQEHSIGLVTDNPFD